MGTSLFARIVAASALLTAGAAGLLAGPGCTLITAQDVGKGVGEPCASKDDCQGDGASCSGGICSLKCTQNSDCPAPSECSGGQCQIPLKVSFVYVGVVEDEGWTLTHDLGRKYAEQQLPYLRTEFVANTFIPDDANKAVDGFIANGANVIVLNSFSLRSVAATKAPQYPNVKFLTCAGNEIGANYGTYFARSYQNWYLAGFAAARKSKNNRIGFVGSFVTPEVVRHIGAYAQGAKRAKPDIKIEVRWEGFWFDLDPADPVTGEYGETKQAKKLMDSGCDVIAHNSDNGRVVEAVEKAKQSGLYDHDIFSIGNDNIDGCKRGPTTCIGVPFWNWGPMYVRIFEEMHRGTWTPSVINDNITADSSSSINVFGSFNNALVDSSLSVDLGGILAELVKPEGKDLPFAGPYNVTYADQRPTGGTIAAGQSIDDNELLTMCWFPQGVVMKQNFDDPLSPDVDARVPDGTVVIGKNGDGSDNKPDCRTNQ